MDSQTKIIWDDSEVHNLRANIAQVKASREEFILLFGEREKRQTDLDKLRVKLNNRIVFNPGTAKRFAVQLMRAVKDHESRFGPAENGRYQIHSSLLPTPPLQPPAFKLGKGNEKVNILFQLLEDNGVKPAFERSCEFLEGKIFGNRFLLGFEKRKLNENPEGKLLDICTKMNMPKDFLASFSENLPEANIVGFGFGEEGRTCIIKAYLEFGDRFYRAIKTNQYHPEPYLSHLGFKWHVADNRKKVLTKYTCYPGFTAKEISSKLGDFYGYKKGGTLEIVKGILNLVSEKAGTDKLLFLDVREENNPRRSFDINGYPANIQMQELFPLLMEISRHYSIPKEDFDTLYASMQSKIFGHIAGGKDREGRDFLTIYFGE